MAPSMAVAGSGDPFASLRDRVAVVTGASSGIGASVARLLAGAGVKVVVGARREDRLRALCEEIRGRGGAADFVRADMRCEEDVERLVGAAAERHGRLDILVNNAGYGSARLVEEGRTEEWRTTLETNVLGVLFACRAALRFMLPRGSGDILNVTSATAREAWPYFAVYGASKAAVLSLSRTLRLEVADRGIRVMTLEVHNVGETEFAVNLDPEVLPRALSRWQALGLLNPGTPLLSPEDVARVALFQLAQPPALSLHEVNARSRAN
ncbi:MAG: oxidoreductase [Candidatus Binatia bacterium]|nr:MAG: oxidoreductase [Candidatus Binatia bacterium]